MCQKWEGVGELVWGRSAAEVESFHFLVVQEPGARVLETRLSQVQHVAAVGDREGLAGVLLDDRERGPAAVDLGDLLLACVLILDRTDLLGDGIAFGFEIFHLRQPGAPTLIQLRHLVYDYIRECTAPCSLSDVLEHLLKLFREDRELAKSLAPEVYAGRTEDTFGKALEDILRYYLRIALVLEWTTSFKQRDSLEIWGLARVVYAGVSAGSQWVQSEADVLGMSPEELADGISALLDCYRRSRIFYDKLAPIYSRCWHESSDEVQRGFIPYFDFPPKGLKEQRDANDKDSYVMQFRSDRGQTLAMNFINELWLAVPFLILLGGLGGYLVVPMNALLQHRGHCLMGAGRSIAVQNFNEQACILLLGGLYVGMQGLGMSAIASIIIFGLIVIVVMLGVRAWYERNLRQHPKVMAHLLRLARESEADPH